MSLFTAFNDEHHIFRSHALQSVIEEAIAFFEGTPVHPLPPTDKFIGPGVYALYYHGPFPEYARLSTVNQTECSHPIYVGKAVPQGARKGASSDKERSELHLRLSEHAESITQVNNLEIGDFRCRFMILRGNESDLIGTAESALIRKYSPLWNTVVSGFGLHDPGGKRYGQLKNMWDTLHPGRYWAERMHGPVPEIEGIRAVIRAALEKLPAP